MKSQQSAGTVESNASHSCRVGLPQTSAYTLMGIKVQADIRVGVLLRVSHM